MANVLDCVVFSVRVMTFSIISTLLLILITSIAGSLVWTSTESSHNMTRANVNNVNNTGYFLTFVIT